MPYGKRKRIYAGGSSWGAKRSRYGVKGTYRRRKAYFRRRRFTRRRGRGGLSRYRRGLLTATKYDDHFKVNFTSAWTESYGQSADDNCKIQVYAPFNLYWKDAGANKALATTDPVCIWEKGDYMMHFDNNERPLFLKNVSVRGGTIGIEFKNYVIQPEKLRNDYYNDIYIDMWLVWIVNGVSFAKYNNKITHRGWTPYCVTDFQSEVGKLLAKRTCKLSHLKRTCRVLFKIKPHKIKLDDMYRVVDTKTKHIVNHSTYGLLWKTYSITQINTPPGKDYAPMGCVASVSMNISGDRYNPDVVGA